MPKENSYFLVKPILPRYFVIGCLNVIILSFILMIFFKFLENFRTHAQLSGLFYFIFFLFPIKAVVLNFVDLTFVFNNHIIYPVVFCIAIFIFVVFLLVEYPSKFIVFCQSMLIVFFPYLLFSFGQAMQLAFFQETIEYSHYQEKPRYAPQSMTRIILLVFDELDFRLTFEARPDYLKLPYLDDIRKKSFFATNAYSCASDTKRALPSIITGKHVVDAHTLGQNDLMIKISGFAEDVTFSSQENLFSDMNTSGLRSTAIFYYHPLERIFGKYIDFAYPYGCIFEGNSFGESSLEILLNQNRALFETSHYSIFGQSLILEKHIDQYVSMLDNLKKTITQDLSDFIFVHWSIPHIPFIYDLNNNKLADQGAKPTNYFGNLKLVDLTLGQILDHLKNNGWVNKTWLIITSDHIYRESKLIDGKEDYRVPLVVYPPGGMNPIECGNSLPNYRIRNLVQMIASGKIKAGQEIVNGLEPVRK